MTAFSTVLQREYWVMLYWITNMPAIFQAFINYIFKDQFNVCAIVYLDDIFNLLKHSGTTYTPGTQSSVMAPASSTLSRQKNVNSAISNLGVDMDTEKVWADTEWPVPTSVKELECFLGFANYCSSPHLSTTKENSENSNGPSQLRQPSMS